MSASVRPPNTLHRVNVDVDRDAAACEARLRSLVDHAPSGVVTVIEPFGFAFRREPDVFSAIGVGTFLGFGLLLVVYTIEAPTTVIGRVGSASSFVFAGLLAARFLRNHFARWEVAVEGASIAHRLRIGRRVTHVERFAADDVVNVLVLGGDGPPRVALGGPRHAVLAELFTLHPLDPETLAPYLAELVALVAKRASM